MVKDGTLPEVQLTVPPKKEFGDFASNFAMQSARALRCNPRVLAQYIVENLDCPYVKKAEIAGPGFINFYLNPDWVYDMLARIVEAGENYGNLPKASDEKIQLEYVSANPTGPLHVGHGRGAAVGSALANLLKAAGYDVEQEYYINDAGNQMNNLARSVNARYLELLGKEIEFPEDTTVTTLSIRRSVSSTSMATVSCRWRKQNGWKSSKPSPIRKSWRR